MSAEDTARLHMGEALLAVWQILKDGSVSSKDRAAALDIFLERGWIKISLPCRIKEFLTDEQLNQLETI